MGRVRPAKLCTWIKMAQYVFNTRESWILKMKNIIFWAQNNKIDLQRAVLTHRVRLLAKTRIIMSALSPTCSFLNDFSLGPGSDLVLPSVSRDGITSEKLSTGVKDTSVKSSRQRESTFLSGDERDCGCELTDSPQTLNKWGVSEKPWQRFVPVLCCPQWCRTCRWRSLGSVPWKTEPWTSQSLGPTTGTHTSPRSEGSSRWHWR